MGKSLPKTDREFADLMESLDRRLVAEGIAIPGRPLKAICEIGKEHGVPLPITSPIPGTAHESYQYWPFTQRVYTWYDQRYGNRLKLDMGPGRMAFLLRGDPWIFRFPLFYGEWVFFAIRKQTCLPDVQPGGPGGYNVLDSIVDFPDGLRASLTEVELSVIQTLFISGYTALSLLDGHSHIELIRSARSDAATTVDHCMRGKADYSLSKWSSLQMAEKILKAALASSGNTYPPTHDLDKLSALCTRAQLAFNVEHLVDNIRCKPGIRYQEEMTDLEGAILAHHAALGLATTVVSTFKLNGN
jgi:hypothetical protein